MEPYVELKNIHKLFPGVYALRDVSICICPGEIHSLVGENGAGNSTLIKIMSGFHQPESGAGRPCAPTTPSCPNPRGMVQ